MRSVFLYFLHWVKDFVNFELRLGFLMKNSVYIYIYIYIYTQTTGNVQNPAIWTTDMVNIVFDAIGGLCR